MNLQRTLITLSALLAWTELATASNMFRGDGNEDANQNIVGGIEATIGRYNYTVALAYVANSFQFCGGSLIAPDIVLTAAHCVGGANFKVVIGRHDLKTSSGEEIVRKSEIRHPQYNGNTMVNDFAIVTLSRPTALDVRYVKLNGDAAFPAGGATSRTMGWGRIKQGGSASSVLREVDLPIITNDVCYQKYSGDIFDSMICTFQPGKDSCQGDSGGPLIIPGSSADTDTLVGIVSWGIGCATNQYPGVYSRVSNGYDWIKTNVCSLSAFPPSDLCGPSATANPTAGSLPTTSPPTNNNQPTTKPPTNKPTNKLPTNKPSKAPRTNKPTKPPKNKPSPFFSNFWTTENLALKPTMTPTTKPPESIGCPPKVRKVKLVSTTGEQLHVFEVQVYSVSGDNIAAEKTATQSSTFRTFLASQAIDNSMSTFSHTNDANAWLEIDMGDVYDVASVSIANRWCKDPSDPNDCLCRLSDANLLLVDGDGNVIVTESIGNACGTADIGFVFSNSPSYC